MKRSRTRPARSPRPLHVRLRRLLLTLTLAILTTGSFTPVQASQTNASQQSHEPRTLLLSENATEDQRTTAARSLLSERRVAPLVEALSPEAPRGAGVAVAAAIRQNAFRPFNGIETGSPDELHRPLIALVERLEGAEKAIAIEALGAYITRDAIRANIACIGPEQPEVVRRAAFASLRRQTGRDQFGADAERWRSWWNEVQWLPEGEWRSLLARAHADRAARLETERTQLVDRVVETHRRLFATTPHTDRSPLLAQMMRDELVGVRRLAFELAGRELLNARPLGEAAIAAVTERLQDGSPEIRAAAATLAGNLSGSAIHERIIEALEIERNPQAAAAMLNVAARRPDGAGIRAALRWFESDHDAAASAADLLLAGAERGLLVTPDLRNSVRRIARRRLEQSITPVLVRLLGVIGDAEERELVAELLDSSDVETRLAAADVLVSQPNTFDRLILAAQSDPQLLGAARRAIRLQRPTADGWMLLRSIEAPTPQEADESLNRLADSLGPRELLRLSEMVESPADRVSLLEQRLGALRDQPDLLSTRMRLRLTAALAEACLGLNEPEKVLAATEGLLDTLPAGRFRIGRERILRARASSLLWVGRLEEPEVVAASPGLWLEALERCASARLAHTADMATHIEGQLLDSMSEQEREKFRSILAELPASLRTASDPASDTSRDQASPDETSQGAPDSTRIADGDDTVHDPN